MKDIIITKLEHEYILRPNYKKTFIVSLNTGVEFLGKLFRIKDDKTIITLRKSSVKTMKRNIKYVIKKYNMNRVSYEYLRCVLMNYAFSQKSSTMLLRRYIRNSL